jgi:RND superfamily putative drug exporter
MAVVQTFDRVTAAFPSEGSAAGVVVEAADVTAAPVAAAIDRLGEETAEQAKLFPGSIDVEVSPDKSVAVVTVPTAGTDGTGTQANRALDELREDVVPATLGQVSGVTANVTGEAAQNRDFVDSMTSHLPVVFLFVLGAAFLLLLIVFRSIVIPLKAIALNLLSVGAAYGVLVLVFQHGVGGSVLGVEGSDSIVPWLPLFLFVILFGLSMDYHVFILTRIREAYDGGMSTEEAVSHGIKSTAGVVTSAAVVMVGVFSIFATLSLLDFKQMGVGLAVAVLIDATIVRGVLLPATMTLLGERNWWLPRSLGWLPKVAPEQPVPAGAAS